MCCTIYFLRLFLNNTTCVLDTITLFCQIGKILYLTLILLLDFFSLFNCMFRLSVTSFASCQFEDQLNEYTVYVYKRLYIYIFFFICIFIYIYIYVFVY